MADKPDNTRVAELMPAALVLASILAGVGWSNYYLGEASRQFADSFQKQSLGEIESGDVFSLSSRLNSVGASVNWTCMTASRGGHVFFDQRRGSCRGGMFRQQVSVFSPNNQGLRIDFTLRLPRTLEAAGAAFLVLQASLLVLLFLSVRRVERLRAESHRRLAELAAQVAHDVRSPLAALKALLGRTLGMPEEDRVLVKGAVERIQAIAEELLEQGRAADPPSETELSALAARVVAEKSLQAPPGLSIASTVPAGLLARAAARELERILSNLVENSAQAIGAHGRIEIGARTDEDAVILSVTDDGPGIPAELLPRLGRRGATFGKATGSGLGLHHARTAVESWGGRLEISSPPGRGTTVTLLLPLAAAPTACDAFLVDDDPLVRMNWALAARKAGRSLRAFEDADSFMRESGAVPKTADIYLDSDLGKGVRGEGLARRLHALGFCQLHLETGRDPSEFSGLPHIKSVRGKEPPWPAA